MKLKFKQQDFQTEAVNAVCDLFAGQRKVVSTFGMEQSGGQTSLMQNDYGIGNALLINEAELLANMRVVQKKHHLPETELFYDTKPVYADGSKKCDGSCDLSGVEKAAPQFSIEMETGTGKTYVYTKTIFELHKQYGFTKFIIVVPSVAIREGVYKSFQITSEHFAALYDNASCRYFIYNSKKSTDVRQFAASNNIEIMIINIDAFRKAENVINQEKDRLNGEAAIRYIQDTNPIVIIDEPQSVDNTQKAKDAIASLNPLCVLRYSATHREKINLLYRLTPVDAYQRGLVKQICVSSNQVAGGYNKPYVRLLSVSNENGFRARVEIDIKGKDGRVARKTIQVKPGADLFKLSGERELYEGYAIEGIDCTPGMEQIEFSNTEGVLLGQACGDIDENIVKRAQIRRTVETHLNKELRYTEKGIKVLSLFFIDRVEKYRTDDGSKGIYAQMFEEVYTDLIRLPKYAPLIKQIPSETSAVHNGYFSRDKKGHYKNTKGDTQDDYNTYNTIMKEKEWLLSFSCPLRFIFSHSTLKEGWDNPNVFQVCTLIEQKSTLTARQKIGRGLRLCVNQDGERIEDRNINLLHVMANESFAEFADTLQKEIEEETGVKFGILQLDLLCGLTYVETERIEKPLNEDEKNLVLSSLAVEEMNEKDNAKLEVAALPSELALAKEKVANIIKKQGEISTEELSSLTYTVEIEHEKSFAYDDQQELLFHFIQKKYTTESGKIKDNMRVALQTGTLDLPPRFEVARAQIENMIYRSDAKPPIRDASRDVTVTLKKEVTVSAEFLELWNKIKQKTIYRVQIDDDELVRRSIQQIKDMDTIPRARIVTQTADIHIERAGVTHTERDVRTMEFQDSYSVLPNVLAIIGEQALIKRSTVYEILRQSGRLQDFLNNPQMYIENVTQIILDVRRSLAVDGISYKKLYGEEYFVQEIFDSTELIANLDRNAVAVDHSVYDYVVYDSGTVEKPFALALDDDPDVKMFFKITSRFKIDTPIGTYNPDWAVYVEIDGMKKLYFVLETKGSTSQLELRGREELKISCGKAHFKAIESGVELSVATSWKEFKIKKVF